MVERTVEINIPDGYKYVGIIDVWTSSGHVVATNSWQGDITDTAVKISLYAKNISTSNTSVFFLASVLCAKSELITD